MISLSSFISKQRKEEAEFPCLDLLPQTGFLGNPPNLEQEKLGEIKVSCLLTCLEGYDSALAPSGFSIYRKLTFPPVTFSSQLHSCLHFLKLMGFLSSRGCLCPVYSGPTSHKPLRMSRLSHGGHLTTSRQSTCRGFLRDESSLLGSLEKYSSLI